MPRDDLIDALRGFALFGILAVNIQSFVWGLNSATLGVLYESSSVADELTVFFTALFFEYKFYPIFCFCFGYGFAMQARRWAARGVNAQSRFTRRMNFMLLMGVLHGTLIWFGDILARYAITGYILRRHIGRGPRELLQAAKFWLCVVLVSTAVFAVIGGATTGDDAAAPTQNETAQHDSERVFTTYTEADYIDATVQRMEDFFAITALYVLVLPQVMLFFLLGAIAAQLKWLRYPARYRMFWQRIFWFGLLVGLPISIAHALSQVELASNPWITTSMRKAVWEGLFASFAPILALAYVAGFALLLAGARGTALIRLFAPAGRIALTLYVAESVLMMLLLNGFALGLGATFGQFELFVTALVIYALLLGIAHWMQHFGIPAPLEGIWRRYTNDDHGSSSQHKNA